ncbi:glucosamine-6-phosphate deaminase [Streptohalobacillus salinus]|uniref:Glucosamine-6-phosphate deaminase n=1 Tax=Streptohalobacillus salinus TaxID=621096 RepID=A0A2V3WI79_9BACI|nr:glucosamine-6-phosphate deaminase [Streptohalobacillus salinus]PXW92147.1 glucosamine-6-phosphate deaminase [Streptohalobacillus salinus]
MKIIVGKSENSMNHYAKNCIIDVIKTNDQPVLGLATGSTPVGMYQALIQAYRQGEVSFKDVTTFNLDEYVNLASDDPNSYRYFMNDQLFNHIDIQLDHTFVPNGNTTDHQQACLDYEQEIDQHDHLDLQVLGIGTNGHIGFNEPGTSFESRTHVIELEPSTREANARFFASLDDVPTHAITMGIETIMESKAILLIARGADKKQAVKELVDGKRSPDFPASALKTHPRVTMLLDEAAASLLDDAAIYKKLD